MAILTLKSNVKRCSSIMFMCCVNQLKRTKQAYCYPKFSTKVETVTLAHEKYEIPTLNRNKSAPPLVVLHGLFGSKRNWMATCIHLQKTLAPTRDIYAVDVRNHGESPQSHYHTYEHLCEDLKRFLDDRKIEKAVPLGHSMGGNAVMLFALTYPKIVDKLIVVDISPASTAPGAERMSHIIDAIQEIKIPSNMSFSNARILAKKQLEKTVSSSIVREFIVSTNLVKMENSYVWRLNLPTLKKYFKDIIAGPDTKGRTFDRPVIFIGGGYSKHIPKQDHSQIRKIFPNAELHYIDNAGHWPQSEKPTEFRKICLNFLNQEG